MHIAYCRCVFASQSITYIWRNPVSLQTFVAAWRHATLSEFLGGLPYKFARQKDMYLRIAQESKSRNQPEMNPVAIGLGLRGTNLVIGSRTTRLVVVPGPESSDVTAPMAPASVNANRINSHYIIATFDCPVQQALPGFQDPGGEQVHVGRPKPLGLGQDINEGVKEEDEEDAAALVL